MVNETCGFRLGVVEGFFGRPWPMGDRRAHAGFLKSSGFDTYVYAPKNDPLLRKEWHLPSPARWGDFSLGAGPALVRRRARVVASARRSRLRAARAGLFS